MHDVIIIGGGPAGVAAAVYAARASLDVLLFERSPMAGGQILDSFEMDNYPGFPGISGFEFGQKLEAHLAHFGISRVTEEVIRLICAGPVKKAITANGEYEAACLIYAAGAAHRKLSVPGEEAFFGRGVSYCAVCDGAFFRGKTVAVIGGGDVALEDALFLSKICEKVFLVHRRDSFRGAALLQKRVNETENIEPVFQAAVESIDGRETVEGITLRCAGEEMKLQADGVFVAVGMVPHTELLKGQADLDEHGYVIAGENCRTGIAGVYAIGDVRTKALRQVITAAADGANAVADFVGKLK